MYMMRCIPKNPKVEKRISPFTNERVWQTIQYKAPSINAFVTIGFFAKNISGQIPIKPIFTTLNAPCSIGTNKMLNNTSVKVAINLSEKIIRQGICGNIIISYYDILQKESWIA